MYRLVICEDDLIHRNILRNLIIKSFDLISNQIELLEFSSGEELLENNLDGIDIFFLDIQLDKLTGMDVAKIIREKNDTSEIIFITSLIDYIQEGYKVRAYRYLLKPIKYEELRDHISSCILDIIKKRENFMIIESKGSINKIPINTIVYIEVRKKELTIYTTKEIYYTKYSMDNVHKELEIYNFFRCHKSYLINMAYVECICKYTVTVNSQFIPVSKHRIVGLKRKLTHVLGDVLC
ncbi:LytTR family DNA-binding domain-containing protein [Clostridium gasigenes]|uniref:LytR/AlgR family response regulator transcription factor n=1 Tax=Clostridium gasigenes TaxID=94869 RepID=UPI001C0CA3DE|nr:LytTR family DNA-binding domain-containing protein [Clostridium gasigenes]MBU3134287.1 LytTR family DNA-binding domain-containing protein [Clostridium gasigenes]